jgi:hypothetical protein
MKLLSYGFGLVLVMTFFSFAYEEWSVPNLTAPTVIQPRAIEVSIQHQFWGRIDGKDNVSRLYGIGDGADVRIQARMTVLPGTQVFAFYDHAQPFGSTHAEFSAGASYAHALSKLHLRFQAEGELFSHVFELTDPESRKTGFFINGCFQSDPLWNRIVPQCDVGYDFDRKMPGLGMGITFTINETFGVFGEYFPVWTTPDSALLQTAIRNPFAFGVKITTSGHQFFFFAGNSMEIGSRNLMRGAADNVLRLGFMIKRMVH